MSRATQTILLLKSTSQSMLSVDDIVVVEEPLEVSIAYTVGEHLHKEVVAVTMRTPGNDEELAVGFLFTERIIETFGDIAKVEAVGLNRIQVTLREGLVWQKQKLDRNFYTTSSCGICGKASIDAIQAMCTIADKYPYDNVCLSTDLVHTLPDVLRASQEYFQQTGSIHGCAVFNELGDLLVSREDVGRHNALDKLIGYAITNAVASPILVLSGRVSFELMQKAAVLGVSVVIAVGAPSSLAVQMAEEWNITLIGFVKKDSFNIYSGYHRIKDK